MTIFSGADKLLRQYKKFHSGERRTHGIREMVQSLGVLPLAHVLEALFKRAVHFPLEHIICNQLLHLTGSHHGRHLQGRQEVVQKFVLVTMLEHIA